MTVPFATCPEPEQLAAYVDGALPPGEAAAIERHLATCADCREIVSETALFLREGDASPQPTSDRARWMNVFAGALGTAAVVALAFSLSPPASDPQDAARARLARLMRAVSAEPNRPVEGRLTGGDAYAPAPRTVRGASDTTAPPRELSAAVRVELAAVERDTGNATGVAERAALGIARLIDGDLDRAIVDLEDVSARAPSAAAWNNLSVAYLERGLRASRRDDLERARDAAARALALSPTLAEAAFNRALAIERLDDPVSARAAWQDAERLAPASPWAAEARERLRNLPAVP